MKKVKTGDLLGVWNGLIKLTLILMGKNDSVFETNRFSNSPLKRIKFENEGSTVQLFPEKAEAVEMLAAIY